MQNPMFTTMILNLLISINFNFLIIYVEFLTNYNIHSPATIKKHWKKWWDETRI